MVDQITARGIVRRGSRVSSPSGAAASKPMNASRQKIMPWKAGSHASSPGMKTLSVFFDPAFTISSVEMKTKIAISMMPRITPVRVEMPTPR